MCVCACVDLVGVYGVGQDIDANYRVITLF